jgi:hypothetical protein
MYINFFKPDLNVPWTTEHLCNNRNLCNIKRNSTQQLPFEELSNLLSINSSLFPGANNIWNCLCLEDFANGAFYESFESLEDELKFHDAEHCTKYVVHEKEFKVGHFTYKVSYFIYVSKGNGLYSATKVNIGVFIANIFPLFRPPYIVINPHPRAPFYEWLSPANESFYAQITCFLTRNSFNNNIKQVAREIKFQIVGNISTYITRLHSLRGHFHHDFVPQSEQFCVDNERKSQEKRQKNLQLARDRQGYGHINPAEMDNANFWNRVLRRSYRTTTPLPPNNI